MQPRSTLALLGAFTLAACSDREISAPATAPTGPALAVSAQAVGGVFVSTNGAEGNAVVAYARAANGSLSYVGTYPTGGTGIGGTSDPLVSQFALALDHNAKFLVVVNAGSNDISSFAVDRGALTLVDREASGGVRPVSVAVGKKFVYALNSVSNTIGVLEIGNDGALAPRPELTRALGAGAQGAAEARLSRDGKLLAVTERVSNTIDVFVVGDDGSLGDPVTTPSAGNVPFGFDFTHRGQLIVSEAGSGSASSYASNPDGSLSVVTGAAPTFQRAPCWLIVDPSGRFAYTANAGSASITGFAIAANGALTLITESGATGDLGAGAGPLDLDMSRDGKFLYVFENGTGTIGTLSVAGDGTLAPLPDTPGLAVRGGYMGLAAY